MKAKNQRVTQVVTFERVVRQMKTNRKACNSREVKLKKILKNLKNLDKVKADQSYAEWKVKEKMMKKQEKENKKKTTLKPKAIEYIVL